MRVGIDATPLLGQRSGVGRYVEGLLAGLEQLSTPDDVRAVLTTFSARGTLPLALTSDRVCVSRRRVPARLLHPLWGRFALPPVEWLSGPVEVFHATNFVLPPSRRAAGVVSIHDLTFLHLSETVAPAVLAYRRLVPRSVERGQVVVAFSEAVAQEIRATYDLGTDDVAVIPHGVDPGWAAAEAAAPADLAAAGIPERYLLVVGNLEPRKNLRLAVAAHRIARSIAPATVPPLVLVGAAGWGDRWGGEAPDPADVIQTGYLDDALLRRVMAGALAVCTPSRYEGFGLPVLEALASGRVVLASDIAAHREISGGTATLLDIADDDAPDRWATAMIEASGQAVDPEAHAVRRAHAAGFTWERSARAHVEAYRRAVSRSQSA